MANPTLEAMHEAAKARAALPEPEQIFVDPPIVKTVFACECGSKRPYTYGWDEIEEAVAKQRDIPDEIFLHVCETCEPRDGA